MGAHIVDDGNVDLASVGDGRVRNPESREEGLADGLQQGRRTTSTLRSSTTSRASQQYAIAPTKAGYRDRWLLWMRAMLTVRGRALVQMHGGTRNCVLLYLEHVHRGCSLAMFLPDSSSRRVEGVDSTEFSSIDDSDPGLDPTASRQSSPAGVIIVQVRLYL